jgi:FHA domain
MSFQVRVATGPRTNQISVLDPAYGYSVGRNDDAQIAVPEDGALSRNHLQVYFAQDQWWLKNNSKHGTLVIGQGVVSEAVVLVPGQQFQAGETTFVFEGQGAEANAAPIADPGAMTMPPEGAAAAAAGQPVGTPIAAQPAAVAAQPVAAADGAPAKVHSATAYISVGGTTELPPELTSHSGPGFPMGPLVKGGLAVVKANLVPSLVMPIAAGIPILGIVVPFNYIAMVKDHLETGEPISIGGLFKFDDIVNRILTAIGVWIGFIFIYVPGMLLMFAIPLVVDKPGTPFVPALKASLSWSMKNLVPMVLLVFVLGMVNFVGMIALGLGMLVTMPTCLAALWLAYQLKRPEIESAAAEAGIQL